MNCFSEVQLTLPKVGEEGFMYPFIPLSPKLRLCAGEQEPAGDGPRRPADPAPARVCAAV